MYGCVWYVHVYVHVYMCVDPCMLVWVKKLVDAWD